MDQTNWVGLLSQGQSPVLKYGSAGKYVRRIQRSLNATRCRTARSPVSTAAPTVRAVRVWQKQAGVKVTGIIAPQSWDALHEGKF